MKYIFCAWLSLFGVIAIGQDKLQLDETAWREMTEGVNYDERKAETLKEEPHAPPPNMDMSWDIDDAFWRPVFFAVIIIVIAVVIIIMVKRSRVPARVGKERTEAQSLEEAEENLPDVTLNNIYNEALEAEEFKSALRIRFLMILQKMIDRQMVSWKRWKTNEQYAAELDSGNLQKLFMGIVQIFDDAWYGNRQINRQSFDAAVQRIDQLNDRLHE